MNRAPLHAVFMLYMAVASNFLAELFPCKVQAFMKNNMLVKHAMAFLLLLFTVVLADPDSGGKSLASVVGISGAVYALFFLTTKCDRTFFLGSAVLAMLLFVLVFEERNTEDAARRERFRKIRSGLGLGLVGWAALGAGRYFVQKRAEYTRKGSFSLAKFLVGKAECANDGD